MEDSDPGHVEVIRSVLNFLNAYLKEKLTALRATANGPHTTFARSKSPTSSHRPTLPTTSLCGAPEMPIRSVSWSEAARHSRTGAISLGARPS
jgi:hypothetical protein